MSLFNVSLRALLELGVSERSERELARVVCAGAVVFVGVQRVNVCVRGVFALCSFWDCHCVSAPALVCRHCLTLLIVRCDGIDKRSLQNVCCASVGRCSERETTRIGCENGAFLIWELFCVRVFLVFCEHFSSVFCSILISE